MARRLDSYDHDVMMVAEAWVDPTRLRLTSGSTSTTSRSTSTSSRHRGTSAPKKASTEAVTEAGVGSTSTWTLSNHDVMRHASRYGLPMKRWRDGR